MAKRSIILAALALLGLASVPALAQTANKTWVSSASGNDTGTCQFVAPCKTFAYAITQTAAGGELDVKDSGSYGVVTITKAISIVSVGALAAISVPSGARGVTVSAGSSDNVVLQGLVIDGHGVGQDGIYATGGNSLTVIDCHIRNFTSIGIYVTPVGNSPSGTPFHISNTEVANSQNTGIYMDYTNGSLKNVDIHDNQAGLYVHHDYVILTDSAITKNTTGISADADGDIIIGNTAIANNNTGIYISNVDSNNPGVVGSYGNNGINQNGTDINGTLTSVGTR